MPAKVKVWDREADGGKGAFVEMFSLHGAEAIRNDPKRYSKAKPGTEPKEVTIEKPKAEDNPEPIPADWETMDWTERRKLAIRLGADRRCTSDIANAIIAAEVRRRSNVKLPEPPPGAED